MSVISDLHEEALRYFQEAEELALRGKRGEARRKYIDAIELSEAACRACPEGHRMWVEVHTLAANLCQRLGRENDERHYRTILRCK